MKILIQVFFFFLPHLSFSQAGNATVTRNGYQLQYPTTWRLDTTGVMGSELFVFSPLTDTADTFSENVNLLIQNLAGMNIDLKAYKEITDKQLAQMFTDSKVDESAIIQDGGKEYYRVSYAMTQENRPLKVTSICFIKDEKAYLITYTAMANAYEQYKKIGEEMLSSFLARSYLKNL